MVEKCYRLGTPLGGTHIRNRFLNDSGLDKLSLSLLTNIGILKFNQCVSGTRLIIG